MTMKILIVASLTPTATANYLITALRDTGNELFVCSDIASSHANLRVRGAVDVAQVCARQGLAPDLVLFIEGGTMRLFPAGLERMPCLTAWYGIDTHMDYAKHLRIGRLFDMTFVAQKEFVERLRQDGLRQVYWLPLACAPEIYPSVDLERCYDFAYVGSNSAVVHPIRHALLAAIRKEYSKVFLGMADPQEMGRIYAQSKIVFNKSVNNDVNMRYFEAMGAGAVLLTDHAQDNGIEEMFSVGEHYLEYRDEQTLLAQIRDLLQDPARCQVIGRAARRRVLERHTYTHRADSLLVRINASVKCAKPTSDAYFAVFSMLRMTGAALDIAVASLSGHGGSYAQRFIFGVCRMWFAPVLWLVKQVERLRDLVRKIR